MMVVVHLARRRGTIHVGRLMRMVVVVDVRVDGRGAINRAIVLLGDVARHSATHIAGDHTTAGRRSCRHHLPVEGTVETFRIRADLFIRRHARASHLVLAAQFTFDQISLLAWMAVANAAVVVIVVIASTTAHSAG